MTIVSTILGDITSTDIGICHSHEHLFIKKGQPERLDEALLLDDFAKTKREVEDFIAVGGRTIVDAQPVGSGRDARKLLKLSEETGIHILASTGFHKAGFYTKGHWVFKTSVEKMTALFVEELENGLFADGEEGWPSVRLSGCAGLIKTAADREGPVGAYVPLFHAAANASLQTGAPIMSHTELGYGAIQQVLFYKEAGLLENQLIICHLDRKMELIENLLRVADTGVYLEMDTIGRYNYHSDEEEAELIRLLLEHGHEDQILLGLDTTRKRMKSYGGTIGLGHLIGNFLPMLREVGVTEKQVRKMMHDNPAKAFSKQE